MNVMEILQKQFQDSAEKLQSVQKGSSYFLLKLFHNLFHLYFLLVLDYSKTLSDRQTLDSQLNENRQVSLIIY